jgi:hypothetical protein
VRGWWNFLFNQAFYLISFYNKNTKYSVNTSGMIHAAFALEFLLAPVGHLKRFRDNKFLRRVNAFVGRK